MSDSRGGDPSADAPGAEASQVVPEPAEPSAAPLGVDDEGVAAWYVANVAGTTLPLRYDLVAGGRSNLTFRVTDGAGRRSVLRRPPTGHLLPTAHDMAREHRVISALRPAGIPVPEALGYCGDPGVTGAPFYVMDFVDGHILRAEGEADGVFDLAARRVVSASLVDTLAALHAVDPDAVGLGDLARREGYINRQLRRWYGQYCASRDGHGGPDVPDIDRVHDRLASAVPDPGPAGVVHGDYRLDNTVVAPDGSVAAVLDWELCTLGDVMADVAQLLVYWTEPGETAALAHAATADPGWYRRAEVAERYAEVSGRSLDNLDFYLAFAYWRLACILEGVYTRYLGGAMGADGFDYHGHPRMIADLAGQAREAADRIGRG